MDPSGCCKGLRSCKSWKAQKVSTLPGTEVCMEQGWAGVMNASFWAWEGSLDGGASPFSLPPKLPWGRCLYHQHPNRCLSSCHGIDALFSNEGVRPLLMEHKPSPCCGCKEGDIVLLTDVQDQLETCWEGQRGLLSLYILRWEGGHHPSDQALFSQGVLWVPQSPPGPLGPTCSLSSTQHDLSTHAAYPTPPTRHVTSSSPSIGIALPAVTLSRFSLTLEC